MAITLLDRVAERRRGSLRSRSLTHRYFSRAEKNIVMMIIHESGGVGHCAGVADARSSAGPKRCGTPGTNRTGWRCLGAAAGSANGISNSLSDSANPHGRRFPVPTRRYLAVRPVSAVLAARWHACSGVPEQICVERAHRVRWPDSDGQCDEQRSPQLPVSPNRSAVRYPVRDYRAAGPSLATQSYSFLADRTACAYFDIASAALAYGPPDLVMIIITMFFFRRVRNTYA